MYKNLKFLLVNTFFFGVVGSYIGGLISVVLWFMLTFSYHYIFSTFLLSPIFGFIPGALTGLLYSLTSIVNKKRAGVLIAALYGALVTGVVGAFVYFLYMPHYTYDVNFKQTIDYMGAIKLAVSLSLLGAVCAIACAKLSNKYIKIISMKGI